jgi:hypothetical protein
VHAADRLRAAVRALALRGRLGRELRRHRRWRPEGRLSDHGRRLHGLHAEGHGQPHPRFADGLAPRRRHTRRREAALHACSGTAGEAE